MFHVKLILMKQQKGFSSLVLIVVFVLLGGGLFYAGYQYSQKQTLPIAQPTSTPVAVITPTPDPTANWKIYSYPLFSLRLPSEWKNIKENGPTQFLNYSGDSGREFDSQLDKGKLKIEIYTENTNLDLKNYVTKQKAVSREARGADWSWSEFTTAVDNQPAIKVKTPTPGFIIYTQHPSQTIILTIAFALDFDNYSNLADQILSTFKFLE